MKRLTRNVARAPRRSARLARRTAQTTFRATLGAVVTTEQESRRLMRAVIWRRWGGTGGPRPFPKGIQNPVQFEAEMEDYIKYLLQLRRMPTLSEVKQLEETIGSLLTALDEVLEEKQRVKAEHAGQVPTEWMEEVVAMFGRKARHELGDDAPPAAPAAPPTTAPSGDHATASARAGHSEETAPPPAKAAPPTPRMAEPFRGYRTLSAAQLLTQIPALTLQELRKVRQYEEKHQRRATILHAVEQQLAALGKAAGTGPPET